MIVELSAHALDRYRQRIDHDAPRHEVESLIREGCYQTNFKGRVQGRAVGYIVLRDCAFPLRLREGVHVAMTCLPKNVRSKADRRAFRELQREERTWAA